MNELHQVHKPEFYPKPPERIPTDLEVQQFEQKLRTSGLFDQAMNPIITFDRFDAVQWKYTDSTDIGAVNGILSYTYDRETHLLLITTKLVVRTSVSAISPVNCEFIQIIRQ